ncbi:MAG: DinB family protein [Gemmatimonadales bacterium]|nr:DinB family protein [Gemmatimonadota bacterium]MBK7784736.1 DinB family protein [Gemmatimonadota bacterium]MBK9066412.1 DinB family protein [Gemmatimonadota bacterium]MBP6668759.1 DinB family protein [Gemmatimonadales bacterium]MBP9200650.1 DinB family protein [Gemmatimonadales bacterium]
MPNRVLRDLLRGRGSHADPVACVLELPADLAGRQVPGVEHTIWELVWHMSYWMDYELRSLAGPEVPYPERADLSWPETDAPPSAAAWAALVATFRQQVDRLGEWSAQVAMDGLGARIVHAERSETVQEVLWQMVAHNSYHTGQVAQLRRAFGAWPPPGGGDTW